jgi:hypothetical protein
MSSPARPVRKDVMLHDDDEESTFLLTPINDEKQGKRSFPRVPDTPAKSHHRDGGFQSFRKKMPTYITFTVIVGCLLAVLIWDLRRTQIISSVIHNDHSGLWMKMNDSSLSRWYTPYDLCLLSNSDTVVTRSNNNSSPTASADYRTNYKNCSKYLSTSPTMRNKALLSSRLFCNIGSSLGKACPAPLSTRKYFSYQLRDSIYHSNDVDNAHFIQTLKKLAKERMLLVFIGDGLSKQNFDALICEISRIEGMMKTKEGKDSFQVITPPFYNNHNDYFTNNINEFILQWKSTTTEKGGKMIPSFLSLTVRYVKISELYPGNHEENGFNLFDFDYLSKLSADYLAVFRKRKLNKTHEESAESRSNRISLKKKKEKRTDSERRRMLLHNTTVASSLKINGTKPVFAKPSSIGSRPQAADRRKTNSSILFNSAKVSKTSSTPIFAARKNITSAALPLRGQKSTNKTVSPVANPKFPKANTTSLSASKTTLTNKKPLLSSFQNYTYYNHSLSFPELKSIIENDLFPNKLSNKSSSTSYKIPSSSASSFHGVFIIANLGVFYNSREKFRHEIPTFLEWLNDLGSDSQSHNIIHYRETAAQHWNHTGNGYYDSTYRMEQYNNGSCVPLADSSPGWYCSSFSFSLSSLLFLLPLLFLFAELDWRNIEVRNIIEKEKLKNIHMIPFHQLTMPLHNMHASNNKLRDCTHYCYFPAMWAPIWYEIYNGVKRKFGDISK